MRTSIEKIILCMLLVFASTSVAIAVEEIKTGAKEMVLYGGSLGNVPFTHRRHQETLGRCDGCHSLFPQTAGVIQKLISQEKLKKKEVMGQCTKCHKEFSATNQKRVPVKCKECHRKDLRD